MNSYFIIKYIHLTTIIISISLFVGRWVWLHIYKPVTKPRWIKIAPHVNDTTLLSTGLYMVWVSQQYPWHIHWVGLKLLLVVVYIVLGFIALKSTTKSFRYSAFISAVTVFSFVVYLALTKGS